jgi:glutamate racemase
MQYQTRQGVFGPMAHGGGIFDNAISGLGSLGATLQTGLVPSSAQAISAVAQQCISASCKDLDEDQLKACIAACNAKAQAAAKKPTTGGGVPAPPVVTSAEVMAYKPAARISSNMIALGVGGLAAAAFVYLYATKKKKG